MQVREEEPIRQQSQNTTQQYTRKKQRLDPEPSTGG